ncbi:unnamed protein product, partial [Amoebophrya sp. A25]
SLYLTAAANASESLLMLGAGGPADVVVPGECLGQNASSNSSSTGLLGLLAEEDDSNGTVSLFGKTTANRSLRDTRQLFRYS